MTPFDITPTWTIDVRSQDLMANDKRYRLMQNIKSYHSKLLNANANQTHYDNLTNGKFSQAFKIARSLSRLDFKNIITENDYLSALQRLNEAKKIFDFTRSASQNHEIVERLFFDNIKNSLLKSRVQYLRNRLQNELLDKWRTHYVLFCTFTVDDHNYYEFWKKGSDYWRKAMQKLKYQSRAGDPNDFTYCAVVEKGDKSGRLHIHALMFMKNLPPGIMDPNAGRRLANLRELPAFRKYWLYGFVTAVMVRFSMSDRFGQSGYRWPQDKETGEAIEKTQVGVISQYLVKYILKNYHYQGDRLWRTRITKNFGMKLFQTSLQKLNFSEKVSILKVIRRKRYSRLRSRKGVIDMKPVRTLVMRDLLRSRSIYQLRNISNNLVQRPSLAQLFRCSDQATHLNMSLASAMSSGIPTSKDLDVYNEFVQSLQLKIA